MQLVLERRAERSTAIAVASPLIAIALTLVTMAILFAALPPINKPSASRVTADASIASESRP